MISMDERDDRDVEDADARGESAGDWSAVEGEDASESGVAELLVLRKAGFLAAGTLLDVVAAAIVVNGGFERTRKAFALPPRSAIKQSRL